MFEYRSFVVQPKPIGMILLEADLVSVPQLELALHDRISFPDFRLGEILAMRGWLKPETADFFARDWLELTKQRNRKPLGYYLQKSALIEEKHIKNILEEQRRTGIRFGTVGVLQGLLKSTTLDFFLMYLFPTEVSVSPFMSKAQIDRPQHQQASKSSNFEESEQITLHQVEYSDETEIIWID